MTLCLYHTHMCGGECGPIHCARYSTKKKPYCSYEAEGYLRLYFPDHQLGSYPTRLPVRSRDQVQEIKIGADELCEPPLEAPNGAIPAG